MAPDTGVRTAASLPTPTRISRGTARSHPRVRITGLSHGMRVAVNIVARCVSCRRQHQRQLRNGVVNRSFYLSYGFRCSPVPAGVVLGVGSPEQLLKKLELNCDALREHFSHDYNIRWWHPTPPKPTKPFISGYSVIAIVLLSSAPGKACLSVCSITLLAYCLFRHYIGSQYLYTCIYLISDNLPLPYVQTGSLAHRIFS